MSEAEKKPRRVLRSLEIDYDNFDAKDMAGNYIHRPPDALSFRKRAEHLPDWTADDLRAVEGSLRIFQTLPRKCMGDKCEVRDTCPLFNNGLYKRWVGFGCPIEYIEAFDWFRYYISSLHITACDEDIIDVGLVCDLVRLQVQMSTCDKILREQSPTEALVTGVDAKSTLEHKQKQPNSHLTVQQKIRADIDKIYQRLLATRQSKVEASAKSQTKEDVSNQLADLVRRAREKRREESGHGVIPVEGR